MIDNNISSTESLPSGTVDRSAISAGRLLRLFMSRWRWFAASLALCAACAVLYLEVKEPVYTRSAAVLIEDNEKGQSAMPEMDFSSLGLFHNSTNVNNEMESLRSPATMEEVVRRLRLDMRYVVRDGLRRRTLYGTSLPVSVSVADLADNTSYSLTVSVDTSGSVRITDLVVSDDRSHLREEYTGTVGESLHTPAGEMTVVLTPFHAGGPLEVEVSRSGIYGAVGSCMSRLTVALPNKEATVVDLTYEDVSPERAGDVLNTLISVYNEGWVRAKNQVTVSTSKFIDERLAVLESELGSVDRDISSYKSEHMIPDIQGASSLYFQESSEVESEILRLSNSLYMTRYVRDYMSRESNRYELLPAGTGLESMSIESQITEYNSLLLQRNNLVSNSSESNPLVVDMDQSLRQMRGAVLTSLDNHAVMLQKQIGTLEGRERETSDKIAASPDQARYLLSVERQQKVKEALYIFLLQKREENELSQTFTAYNTRVITPPSGKQVPTSPNHAMIVLAALAFGLLLPGGVIFVLDSSDSKVRDRKDLDGLQAPFLGELPQVGGDRRRSLRARVSVLLRQASARSRRGALDGREDEETLMAVESGNRNVINEAFRVLRTNIEFMSVKGGGSSIIMVTSFNPGSGKTFVTMNTAMSLAVRGRRVLVIDGDLRHGSASRYAGKPRTGLSDWLAGRTEDLRGSIVRTDYSEHLDVLPIGTVPPNPTELLLDPRLQESVSSFRRDYDYIFIDCPPVNMVADSRILSKLADRTLFVIRAGLLERGMLSDLDRLFKSGEYPGMSVVLNGTSEFHGRYGYGYGYGYGHSHYYYYGKS